MSCWCGGFNTNVLNQLITADVNGVDLLHFLPGVVGVGVRGAYGTSSEDTTDCFWGHLLTQIILFEESCQSEQNAAIITIFSNSYIGFAVALAFGRRRVENLNVISKSLSQAHLRDSSTNLSGRIHSVSSLQRRLLQPEVMYVNRTVADSSFGSLIIYYHTCSSNMNQTASFMLRQTYIFLFHEWKHVIMTTKPITHCFSFTTHATVCPSSIVLRYYVPSTTRGHLRRRCWKRFSISWLE